MSRRRKRAKHSAPARNNGNAAVNEKRLDADKSVLNAKPLHSSKPARLPVFTSDGNKKILSVLQESMPEAKKETFSWKERIKKFGDRLRLALTPQSNKEALIICGAFFAFTIYNAVKMVKTCPWGTLAEPYAEAEEKSVDILSENEWSSLTSELNNKMKSWPAEAGIILKDFETGRVWKQNANGRFRSASLIKVPIAAALMEKLGEGDITLDTSLKVSKKNRVSGSGTLRWEDNGTPVPLNTVLFKMITESDNTATKMIVDEIGFDSISVSLRHLGLEDTNVCPNISNMTSRKIKDDSFTTPKDIAGLFEKIYSGSLVDKKHSDYLLAILKQTKSRNRLRAGLPEGWQLGHKTGLLRKACHDAGIVFSPRGDYLLVVMTGDVPNYRKAKSFISSIGKITYKYYRPHAESGIQETI